MYFFYKTKKKADEILFYFIGYMSLFMPTWHPVKKNDMPPINLPPDLASELPPDMVQLEHKTQVRL